MLASVLERQAAALGSRGLRASRPARLARPISTSAPLKLGESSRSAAAESPQFDDEFGFDDLSQQSARENEGVAEPESFGLDSKPIQPSSGPSSLDRIFGDSRQEKPESFFRDRLAEQPEGWTEGGLQAMYRPSSTATAPATRKFKGVHKRENRWLGATPAEAAAFNSVIAGIFADLESKDALRPGSGPTKDPYGSQLSMGRALARAQKTARSFAIETGEIDEDLATELDQHKESMSLLTTDVEVLEWAKEHIFTQTLSPEGEMVYSRSYPHILAHAMRLLRKNFNNPHLSLALFQQAQSASLESYLSGCLTSAYNEVLLVRWYSFRDLAGIEHAVREMDSNGLKWDKTTRKLIDTVCDEVSLALSKGPAATEQYGDEAASILRTLEQRVQSDMKREQIIQNDKRAAPAFKWNVYQPRPAAPRSRQNPDHKGSFLMRRGPRRVDAAAHTV